MEHLRCMQGCDTASLSLDSNYFPPEMFPKHDMLIIEDINDGMISC